MGYQWSFIHQIIPAKKYAQAQSNLQLSWELHLLPEICAKSTCPTSFAYFDFDRKPVWFLPENKLPNNSCIKPALKHGFPAFTWHEHPKNWYQNLHQIYTSLTATGTCAETHLNTCWQHVCITLPWKSYAKCFRIRFVPQTSLYAFVVLSCYANTRAPFTNVKLCTQVVNLRLI